MTTPSAHRALLMALFALCVLAAGVALQGNDQAPALPQDEVRCGVCGTAITDATNLAQVRFADGTTVFFDGPAHLFRFLASPGSYAAGKGDRKITASFVTTFESRKTIPVQRAWFVLGSDQSGQGMIALESLEKANQFIIEHGGTRLVQASDVTPSLLAQLP